MGIISIIIIAVAVALFLNKREKEHEEEMDRLDEIKDKIDNANKPHIEMSGDELVDEWFNNQERKNLGN